MSLKSGLRALLIDRHSIRSLLPDYPVGKQMFPRVFCEGPAQGVNPPFILIHQISHDPMKVLEGTSGMATTEIDVDCYALDHTKAEALGELVEGYLKDFTGLLPNGVTVDSVLWENMRYDRDIMGDGTDSTRHIISHSFEIQSH